MRSSAQEVEHAASGVPVLQVAVDGWWERAASAALPGSAEDVERLLEAAGTGEAAVEVLWPGPPVVFVGARFARGRPPLRELAARADWSPSQALRALAGGPLGPPVRAELGAFNAWRSLGPLRLALDATAPAVRQALARRPDLAHCPRPVALEIAHDRPREAWWAIEVSVPRDAAHAVSADRVAQLLAAAR
jgi:hypothetical protein